MLDGSRVFGSAGTCALSFQICANARTHTQKCVDSHACTYACVQVHVYTCTQAHARTHTCMLAGMIQTWFWRFHSSERQLNAAMTPVCNSVARAYTHTSTHKFDSLLPIFKESFNFRSCKNFARIWRKSGSSDVFRNCAMLCIGFLYLFSDLSRILQELGQVKHVERMLDKCDLAYQGRPSRMLDLCRQKLVFETPQVCTLVRLYVCMHTCMCACILVSARVCSCACVYVSVLACCLYARTCACVDFACSVLYQLKVMLRTLFFCHSLSLLV